MTFGVFDKTSLLVGHSPPPVAGMTSVLGPSRTSPFGRLSRHPWVCKAPPTCQYREIFSELMETIQPQTTRLRLSYNFLLGKIIIDLKLMPL